MKRSAAEIIREYGPFPGIDRVAGVTFDGEHVWFASGDKLNALDPATGKVLKQARLLGALGDYFSSPVGADDKIYALSEEGKGVVIKPGAEWEILAVNDLGDSCKATPAIAGSRLYIRTRSALYCFARRD